MDVLDQNKKCALEDVAAYADGELEGGALASFESHVKVCGQCAEELRGQRELLCTLDAAFNDTRSFLMPLDFTRVVSAHAQSDVRGVRHKSERRRALKVCAVLALVSFALLGAAFGTVVIEPAKAFARAGGNVLELIWRTVYDAGTGLAVIVRVLSRALVLDSHGFGLLIILPFLLVVCLLPLLIASYHRARVAE